MPWMRQASVSAFDDFVVNQLLLYFLAARIKREVLSMQFKFQVAHGPSGAVFLDGEDDPVTILLGRVRIKSDVVFGQNLILVVHDNGNVGLIIERTAAPQMIQMN